MNTAIRAAGFIRQAKRRATFVGSMLLLFVALSLLLSPACLQAAPFSKHFQFTQPNGVQLTLWGEGDEFRAVFETTTGYTVVFDPQKQAYFYAERGADGKSLISTGVLADYPVPRTLAQHVRMDHDAVSAAARERKKQWDADTGLSTRWSRLKSQTLGSSPSPKKAGALPTPSETTTIGTKKGLTLLIDFSDAPATISQMEIDSFLNSDSYTGFGNNGSVKKYFSDVSASRLTYTNLVTVYVRMSQPKSYYNDTSVAKNSGDRGRLLINDALTILKARSDYNSTILPTLNALTTNGSDNVVAFNVFFAGADSGVWSSGLWPHSWVLSSPVALGNGKSVSNYQITNVGTSLELGTFCHENGHMLCDFPDIYDYDYDSIGGAGKFCLMGNGGHGTNPSQVNAYLKLVAGWATPTDVSSTSNLTGTLVAMPNSGFDAFYRYRKPGIATEYFLLENRQMTGRDAALPAAGLAVWHVDELGDKDNQSLASNSSHQNYELTLVQADNLWHFQYDVNSGDAFDLYYQGNSAAAYTNRLDDSSTPNAHWWDGSASRMNVNSFSVAGTSMTFKFGTGGSILPAPVLAAEPAVTPGTENTVYWNVAGEPSMMMHALDIMSQSAASSVKPLSPITANKQRLAEAPHQPATILGAANKQRLAEDFLGEKGLPGSLLDAAPNLTPYQPTGWSDKIVVSNGTGTNTDSSPLTTTDTVYVDFAVLNSGTMDIVDTYYVDVYLDDVPLGRGSANPPHSVNYYKYWSDYSIGTLTAGTHTIRIVTDSTGMIAESNENDNEYTKTFTVYEPVLTEYYVEGANNSDFNSPINSGWTTQTQWTFSSLTPGVTYWYRVKARRGTEESVWSNSEFSQQEPPPVSLQLSSATYSVNKNGGSVTITATRTGGSSGTVGISYATSNGTATAGSDYTATNGTLSWANGDTANKAFTVPIINDTNYEGNESFTVTLSSPTGGATLGGQETATVTIVADETAPTITTFTVPSTSNSLLVTGIILSANDVFGVTGYLLTETAAPPAASAAGWSSTAPTQYVFASAGSKTLYSWAKDAAGNVSTCAIAIVTITLPDTTAPVVTSFDIPSTAISLTIPITAFTASDSVGITGYLLTEMASQPQPSNPAWSVSIPTSYLFAEQGVKTLYAFAKDDVGNISVPLSDSVAITLADTTAPTVTSFSIPTTATSLNVPVSTLSASDNVAVTGYLLSEIANQPQSSDPAWSAIVPTSYLFASQGAKTLYAFAKDAAGNISVPLSSDVMINLSDTTAPTVTAFTLPATATNLTVPISSLAATDAVGVTGYLLNETASEPPANDPAWSASVLTSHTFATQGAMTLYVFAKDAAGNVSSPQSAAVTITLSDATAPTVTAFTILATSTSLTVPVSLLTATDAVGVTGYLLSEIATIPSVTDIHWTTTPTSSYTFANAGAKTLYAWAKDAAGNVSAAVPAAVAITLPDTTVPTVNLFTMPTTATSLTIAVTALTATDDVAVTGYLLSESTTPPQPDNPVWTSTPPTSYTLVAQGSRTVYAFAKDAAGNVSTPLTATVTITFSDTTAPTITAFALPATASSLTVPVTIFSATDNKAVTGYFLSESTTIPLAADPGWTSTQPGSHTFSTSGNKTLFAFAKDAAGNVSPPASTSVVITLPVQYYTVTPTAGTNGTISPSIAQAVNSGATTIFTVTPASGYQIATATGCGGTLTGSSYTTGPITGACTVSASFSAIPVTAAPTGDTNGDGNVNIKDALIALRIAVGLIPMDTKYLADGDVAPYINGKPQPDMKIDISDALVILKKCVGLINW